MEEFMNCIPCELKQYLNERKWETGYEMAASADEYAITHRKERERGDVIGQSKLNPNQNIYSSVRGDNRGNKEPPHPWNEQSSRPREILHILSLWEDRSRRISISRER